MYTYTVRPDEYGENPREYQDNFGTLMMWTRHGPSGDAEAKNYNPGEYGGWEEFQAVLEEDFDGVLLPVYMYSHGGQTISTRPFSCPWDSGQVGFIGVAKDAILTAYSRKRMTKALRARATAALEAEVKEYAAYMEGDVWQVAVHKVGEEPKEFMGGIYGRESAEAEGRAEAKYMDNWEAANGQK